jgi:osmotically inducible lipoprotein OsmB
MHTHHTLALLTLSATFLFGGCAGMSRQEVSTITGAAAGAVVGAAVGGPAATAGGAVLGGVIGHEVGKKP